MAFKYQIIADTLRENILSGFYQNTGLLPTEFEISQKYQCSRQTVRRALELLVDEQFIEKRQGSGSYIRETPASQVPMRTIAVITTYISDYIFPGILREIETVLSNNNCTPLLFATQNQVANERKILLSLLSQKNLDGILVEGTKTGLPNPNLDLYRKLMDTHIPLVFMNGCYPSLPDAVSVLDDNYNGSRILVEYLHRKGHHRIGGLFKIDDMQGLQRYAGYADTVRDLQLPLEDQTVAWYDTDAKQRFLTRPDLPQELIRNLLNCSAIVCYNDEIASRLVVTLLKMGLRIPEDVAVVSFDNSQYSNLAPVRITSLSHGGANVGRMAAETMIRILRGLPCSNQRIPWVLAEKESS